MGWSDYYNEKKKERKGIRKWKEKKTLIIESKKKQYMRYKEKRK